MNAPFKVITNIRDLPHYTEIVRDQVKASDMLDDPKFDAIKLRNRERAVDTLTRRWPELKENPQYVSGSPVTFDRYNVADSLTNRLGELLGLRYPQARLQTQKPGGVLCMHVDDLNAGYVTPHEPMLPRINFDVETRQAFESDPSTAIRFLIFIEDGYPGQGVIFNDTPLVNWKAGDVVYWDWQTVPHATFNGSFWDRHLVRLTGMRTELTQAILDGQLPNLYY